MDHPPGRGQGYGLTLDPKPFLLLQHIFGRLTAFYYASIRSILMSGPARASRRVASRRVTSRHVASGFVLGAQALLELLHLLHALSLRAAKEPKRVFMFCCSQAPLRLDTMSSGWVCALQLQLGVRHMHGAPAPPTAKDARPASCLASQPRGSDSDLGTRCSMAVWIHVPVSTATGCLK